MKMGISQTPLPGEEDFHEETKAFLAMLRSLPPVSVEEDPNDWLSQICGNLRRSPAERLSRWSAVANEALWHKARLMGVPHVGFAPGRVLRALSEQGVAFVLVGMGAGYVQGAPYPSANTDVTPLLDVENLRGVDRALGALAARPLKHDLWSRVDAPVRAGFRRLLTSAGMVNVVDALPGVGDYQRLMEQADVMDVGRGLAVWVASLEDVICSKENVERADESERSRDALHVMMCKETVAARTKYGFVTSG